MKLVLLGVIVAAAVFGIRWIRRKLRQRKARASSFVIPPDAVISPAPLLAEDEIALYNLLQLVVQERYLVLAQVPLWSFIAIDGEARARTGILRHIALKRVDFFLIHPGSRRVEYVVQVTHEAPRRDETESHRIIESVLGAAGIKLMKLQSKKSYSLPDLTARLELTTGD
jgi:hypothetical protein